MKQLEVLLMCITFRTDLRKRSSGGMATWTSACLIGGGLCDSLDSLDLTDFVLWEVTGDVGRWIGRIGERGGTLSSSSSRSGVRERPSESLKLFSLGMVVVVVVTAVVGGKIETSCSVLPFATASGRSSERVGNRTWQGA